VLIDLDRQAVYFGNLGAAANDRLMTLFLDTFACGLEPANADRLAYRLMQSDTDGIEHARPFHLVREPPAQEGAPDDFDTGDRSFLGKELLTWLWFKTDTDASAFRVSSGDEVSVMIDRVLRLECDFAVSGTDVITADGPATLPESRAALTTGKQPTKMGLVFGGRAGEFSLVLEGRQMAVTGLVLPKEDRLVDEDPKSGREQRFEQIADAAELLDVLYELFLRRRTAGPWRRELGRMRAWAAGGGVGLTERAASA
jgi:recombination associated protein RdgC